MSKEARRRENRCDECGLFRAWDDLMITGFQPDSEFGGESIERACCRCRQKKGLPFRADFIPVAPRKEKAA